jgi:purine-binding chemotaxis protein CheW
MNLSEIRKKAQLEKAGSAEVPVSTPCIAPAEGAGIAAGAVEAAPEDLVNLDIAEIRLAPLTSTEAPSPQVFDPLALLLAGRAIARSDGGMQTADLFSEHDGADFQELLCFRVADEKYAINIMEIKEIIKPREVTEVPRVPPYVSGVLSLRGIIIPVFNMHKRLGHVVMKVSGKERIIVVKKGEEFCGVMVDEVIQVVRISFATIEPPPAVLDGIDRDFVDGIGRFDGHMLILLNLEKVLDLNLF